MGMLDLLFGRRRAEPQPPERPVTSGEGPLRLGGLPAQDQADRLADANEPVLERYRSMLRTAPPDTIERAHAEAFERLTLEQRSYVLRALAAELPEHERASADIAGGDPQAMARVATRAEMRSPGSVERSLAAHGAPTRGGMPTGAAGSLLTSFAMGFVGSVAATAFLEAVGDPLAGAVGLLPGETPAEEEYAGLAGYGGGFEEL